MNARDAPGAIARIANSVGNLTPREFAVMCLFRIRHHRGTGVFADTFGGPNTRFTKADADYLCEQIQLRATLPDHEPTQD